MTETPPQPHYRAGDIANGHILGFDGHWRLIQQDTAPPLPIDGYQHPAQRAQQGTAYAREKAGYVEKFARRWKPCWLIMLGLTAIAMISNAAQNDLFNETPMVWIIDVGLGTIIGGSFNALVVCLIAAFFPGDKKAKA